MCLLWKTYHFYIHLLHRSVHCSLYVIRQNKFVVSELVSNVTLSVILKEILTFRNCRIAAEWQKNDVTHSL